jgi:predicted ribosome quality control (RQC) complex YloA/Tae2 family protein
MRGIAAIEVNAVVNELKDKVAGSYFKSFYELADNAFLLVLTKERKQLSVYINLTKAINETEFREKAGEPTQFAMQVRKRLDGSSVRAMSQHGSDRIVVIEFTGKEENLMVIEMFDKGNLLLVGKDGLTHFAYANRSFKERTVSRGMIYAFPQSDAVPYDQADKKKIEEIVEKVKESDQKLISAISKFLNVGPMYLEEAIAKADLKAGSAAKTQKIDEKILSEEIFAILETAKKPEPRIYKKWDAAVDFAITKVSKYENDGGIKNEGFATMSKLFDAIYLKERTSSMDTGKLREIEELTSSIAKQKTQIEFMRSKGEDYKAIANRIYERMGEINELLFELKKRNPRKLEDVGTKFGNINLKGLDARRKTVKIELD